MALNDPMASMLGDLELPVDPDAGMAGVVWVIAPQRRTGNIGALYSLSIRVLACGDARMHPTQGV